MGYFHALVMVLVSAAAAEGEQTKGEEAEPIDAANRTVRLLGGVVSRTRGQNLGAKFVEIEPESGKELGVYFPPGLQAKHAPTLMNIIRSTMRYGEDRYTLHEPQFEVIFSIPKDKPGEDSDFDRWYLVSIKLPEAKKKPPRDTVKAMPGYDGGGKAIFTGPENRAVKLVGVKFSESRRHELLAKFAEAAPQQGMGGPNWSKLGREIELGMGDTNQSTRDQTLADVAHTRTILNIIESSVSSTPLPNPRLNETPWREPQFEVFFSIPQDAQGHVNDFTRWSLIAIKLPEARRE